MAHTPRSSQAPVLLTKAATFVLPFLLIIPFAVYAQSSNIASAQKQSPMSQNSKSDAQAKVHPSLGTGSPIPADLLETAVSAGVVDPNLNGDPGAFTYQYPFTVPPGRNGMTPSLSLNYSSNSHDDSGFGYGWGISIPYIERYDKLGENNLYSTSTPSNTFYSSLSGELVASSTANNYLARNDDGSYTQYSFSGNSWTVTDRSGNTYLFGAATSTRQDDPGGTGNTFKWMLQEEIDPNGNYVLYTYTKDLGQIYPSVISYTNSTTGGGAGIFSVGFTLSSNASSSATSTATGFPVRTRYRVTQLAIQISSTTESTYTLNYTAGDNGSRSILSSVTQSGTNASGTLTLPATTFGYSTSTPASQMATSTWGIPIGYFVQGQSVGSISFGDDFTDINGDGLMDMIRSFHDYSGNFNYQFVYMNTGNGWSTASSTYMPPCWFETYSSGGGYEDGGGRLVDINGDGLPDFICGSTAYINNGSNWVASSTWNTPIPMNSGGYDGGVRFADVNGDGLPDLIYGIENSDATYTDTLYLNNGHGWTQDTSWTFPPSFGFTTVYGQDAGGRVFDVNGDGLADLIVSNNVYINNGHGWTLDPVWTIPSSIDVANSSVIPFDINGDGLIDLTQSNGGLATSTDPNSFYWLSRQTYLNTGSGWATSTADLLPVAAYFSAGMYAGETGLHTGNMSGAGLPDLIANAGFGGIPYTEVMFAQGSQPDLLTHIAESAGKGITVNYKSTSAYADGSGNRLNPHLPFYFPAVQSISYNDGVTPTSTESYVYNGGTFYDAGTRDRRFAGFSSIAKTDESGNISINYYHTGIGTSTSLGEYNDNQSKIGKIYRTENYDGANNLFKVLITKWDGFVNGLANFVWPDQTTELDYDGLGTHKDLASSFTYSSKTGDLLQQVSWGAVNANNDGTFTDTGTDALTTNITYAASYTIPFDKPSEKTTLNQSSSTLSDIKYYYDGNTTLGLISAGNLTQQQTLASSTATSTYITTKKNYTAYGLVSKDINPLNASSTYLFDSHKLYPASVTNALSQLTSYLYNYFNGKQTQVTDPNGEVTQTNYDALNRVSSILKPDPVATSTLATTTLYTYTTSSYPQLVQETDYLNSASTTNKYTYTDGFGRVVEKRDPSATTNTYSVSDTYYNGLDLVSSKSLPYFGTGTSYTGVSMPPTSTLVTTYSYDPLQRLLSTTNSVGSTINTYGNWKVTTKDPNGNLKDYYKDAFGNLTNVVEHNSTTTATTTYSYDGNNNLILITDALGNVRNFTYDLLGRRLSSQDLHASGDTTFGTWQYIYDNDGNLTKQTDPKNQVVNYTYDKLDRVLTEDYTGTSGIDQNYTYDTCTDGIGRLCTASSTSSITSYLYDLLSNTVKETETIATSSYITQHAFDRQGNVTGITYPDNSQVAYTYNAAGLLASIGQKEAGASNFSGVVTNIDYAPTNKITDETFGNGVVTTNTYDATKLYRLIRIHTIAASGIGTLIEEGGGGSINAADTPAAPTSVMSTSTMSLTSPFLDFYADDILPDSFTADSSTSATSTPLLAVSLDLNESTTTPAIPPTNLELTVASSSENNNGLGTTTPITSTSTLPVIATTTESTTSPITLGTSSTTIATTTATSTPNDAATTTPDDQLLTLKTPIADLLGDMQLPDGTIKYAYNTHVSLDGLPPSSSTLSEAKGQGLTITNEVVAKRTTNGRVFATDKANVYVADITSGDPLYYKDTNGDWWVAAYGTTTKAVYDSQTQPQNVSLIDKIINFFLPSKALAATNTFYPGSTAVDGYITKEDSMDWPTTRNAGAGDTAAYNSSGNEINDELNGYNYYGLTRAIILFDTSSLSGAGNISSASLSIYAIYETSNGGPGYPGFYITSSSPSSNIYLITSDYAQLGSTSFGYYGGSIPEYSYTPVSLNPAGIAAISKTGITELGLRTYNDMNNIAPTTQAQYELAFGSAESGMSEAPELTITYTYAPTGPDDLLTDGQTDPTNLGDHVPSFDAIFNTLNPSDYATDYQLQISTSSTDFSTPIWDTSEASITASTTNGTYAPIIAYAGSTLASLTNYFWRIRFWDSFNNIGFWSTENASFSISPSSPPSAPTNLQVNGLTNPTSLGSSTPSFTATYNQNYASTSVAVDYEIQVSASSTNWSYLQWDSNEQTLASTTIGSTSPAISYDGGGALVPSTTYYWRIRFWNNYGFQGLWSTATSSFAVSTSLATPDLQDIYYTYDPDGNITQINDYSGTGAGKVEQFSYDALNRLLSGSTAAASSSPFSQSYSYGLTGNLTNKSDVGNYSYADTGDDDPDAPTAIGSSTLAYDNDGNLTSYGPSSYTWDYRNELTGVGNGTATSTYGYDYQSNRDQKTVEGITTYYPNNLYNIAGTSIVRNVYDTMGNLVSTTQGGGSGGSGTSTPALNVTATSSSNGYNAGPVTKTWTHVVGSGLNRILVLTSSIWQDAAGTGTISSATYNGVSLTKAVGNNKSGIACEEWYLINPPSGSHTMSVTITGATDTIKLDSSDFTGISQSTPVDATVHVTGTSGNPTVNIIAANANDLIVDDFARYNTVDANTNRTPLYKDYNGSMFGAADFQIAATTGTKSDTYTGPDTDNWCMNAVVFIPAVTTGSATTTTYIHADNLGSTNVTTDTSGNLAQTLDYYPFGSSRMNTGTPTQQRTYIGQIYDANSNLSYLNARYYDGGRGQFLSQDPVFLGNPSQQNLQDPQSLNSYSYSENNPITRKDPFGKDSGPFSDFFNANYAPGTPTSVVNYEQNLKYQGFEEGFGIPTASILAPGFVAGAVLSAEAYPALASAYIGAGVSIASRATDDVLNGTHSTLQQYGRSAAFNAAAGFFTSDLSLSRTFVYTGAAAILENEVLSGVFTPAQALINATGAGIARGLVQAMGAYAPLKPLAPVLGPATEGLVNYGASTVSGYNPKNK